MEGRSRLLAILAMAVISLEDPKDRVTTIEFKFNLFVPISKGKLTAEAKIVHKGSKTAVGGVEVIDETGKLVAKATGTYSITRGD